MYQQISFMKQANLYEILQPSETGNFSDWARRGADQG